MRCFMCNSDRISRDADFTFDECGVDGEGFVYEFHCMNCGASITYRVAEKMDDIEVQQSL